VSLSIIVDRDILSLRLIGGSPVYLHSTTTELTSGFSLAIARMLGLESIKNVIELVVRGVSSSFRSISYDNI
jgi:hypothetical protein